MLNFLGILRRAALLAGAIIAVDGLVAYLLSFLEYAFVEMFGDLVLVEVAVLFIVAGLIDFASSVGVAQFRKSFMSARDGYSALKHKESARRASVLVLAGLILFVLLVAGAIFRGL
jgi:hypothetical protein